MLTLHEQAMEKYDSALLARRKGREEEAQSRFRDAFALVRKAVEYLTLEGVGEPIKSVVLRGAAIIALACAEHRQAEKFVSAALAGDPPTDVAEELRHLSDEINFGRHLSLRGIQLDPRDILFTVSGNGIGPGVAPADAVNDRIDRVHSMITRSFERNKKQPYREKGLASTDIRRMSEIFLSVARDSSYAVTIRVGQAQQELDDSETTRVLTEVIDFLNLYNLGDEVTIRERMGDEQYYKNFIGLAKQISPDGDVVSQVGLVANLGTETKTVALRAKMKAVVERGHITEPKAKTIPTLEVSGYLRAADSLDPEKDSIIVVEENGLKHRIHVPSALMADIVLKMYESKVAVVAVKGRGGAFILEDINKLK